MYYTHKRIILNDLDKITSGKLSLIAVCVCVGWCVCLCSFGRIGEFASPLFSLQHSRRYIRVYAGTVVHGMCLWSAVLGQTIKKNEEIGVASIRYYLIKSNGICYGYLVFIVVGRA